MKKEIILQDTDYTHPGCKLKVNGIDIDVVRTVQEIYEERLTELKLKVDRLKVAMRRMFDALASAPDEAEIRLGSPWAKRAYSEWFEKERCECLEKYDDDTLF